MTRSRLASRTRPGPDRRVGSPRGRLAPVGLALALAFGPGTAPAQVPAPPARVPGDGAPAAGARRVAANSGEGAKADAPKLDPRLKGYKPCDGFRAEVVADEDLIPEAPSALAFDDRGRAYVAEVAPAARTFDVRETVARPDDAKVRLVKRRKSSLDCIRRLADTDGDGKYDASEVVVDGIEQPTALVYASGALYVATLGRLERWTDEDGDDRFETRAVLLDGFGAVDGRGLIGLTLGLDGYLYLTAGDNETQAFAPDGEGAPLRLARSGGLYRCRPDGSGLRLIAHGFRQPRGGVQFDAEFRPVLLDDDGADGSRLAGARLIQPVEGGDYGWRLMPDSAGPDHDLGTLDGDRPGRLAGLARLAGGAPASFAIYQGALLPEACRGVLMAADPARHAVRGIRLVPAPDGPPTVQELPLLSAEDDRFRPCQVVVGADSALYILDRREAPADARGAKPGPGAGQAAGRIYRLAPTPGGPLAPSMAFPNNWDRVKKFTRDEILHGALPHADGTTAERSLHELVERGADQARAPLLAVAADATAPPRKRILALLGARRCWNGAVEAACLGFLNDPDPAIRRLAAQGLADEPATAQGHLAAKLLERLEDPDPRAVRAIMLGIGRHGAGGPSHYAPNLVRWLYAHPKSDVVARDGALRGLERLGDGGVDEVALAVKTRRGVERAEAVRLFAGLRAARAAEILAGLARVPDLAGADRSILIRQFADFPAPVQVATTPLVEWVVKHPEVDPVVKLATLETCRLVGNPASALILQLIDDDDEAVRVTATRLAGRTRPPGSMARLAARLSDEQLGDVERLAIARSLRGSAPAQFPALDAAYLAAERPELRRALLRALAAADGERALPALAAALAGPDPANRAEALAILAETPAGALQVAQAYLDRTLARADLPVVLRALERHEAATRERERKEQEQKAKDKDGGPKDRPRDGEATEADSGREESPAAREAREVRAALASVRRDATEGGSALKPAAVRALAAESGNPWAGRATFFGGAARCSACHEVAGQGGKTAPALDAGAHDLDPERIVAAIRHPGRGKPAADAPRLAMRADSAGAAKPLAGLDRARASGATTAAPALPTGLDLRLTPTELADLVAFLGDSGVQEAVRQGRAEPLRRWLVAGPFATGADAARVPLDRVDPARAMAGQGGRRVAWHPQGGSTEGRLDLDGWLTAEPGRLYAATELRTEAAQVAWLSTATRGAARVYLNGAKVADLPEAATPADAPAPVRLALRAGPNLVMVAFDSPTEGPPAASFVLAAPRPVEGQAPRGTAPGSPARPAAEKPEPKGATADRSPSGNVELKAPEPGAEASRAPKGPEP